MRVPTSRPSNRRFFAIGGSLVALLLLAGPVFADFPDDFDSYSAGTQNPGPWTFHAVNNNCYGISNQISNIDGNAESPPNTYTILYDQTVVGCGGGVNNAYLYTTFVAFKSSVSFKMDFGLLSSTGAALQPVDEVQVAVCPVGNFPPGGCLGGNLMAISAIPTTPTYVPLVGTASGLTRGTSYWVMVWVLPQTAGVKFNFQMDNFYLNGGNIIFHPFDLRLLESSTRLPFNITKYPGSSVQVQYSTSTSCTVAGLTGGDAPIQTAANVCTINNLYTSFIEVPLTSATLITVTIGANIYTRTKIPESTNETVLMDPAVNVVPYVLVIQDVSQTFVAGTKVNVTTPTTVPPNPIGTTITSGYLDTQVSFVSPLPIGTYTLTLTTGDNVFSTTLRLGTVCSNIVSSGCGIPIQITTATVKNTNGFVSNINFVAYWNCGPPFNSITGSYIDSQGTTASVTFRLYNVTSTGTFLVPPSPVTLFGAFGTATHIFTGIVPGSYQMLFSTTGVIGAHSLGPVFVSFGNPGCPNASPGFFTLPNFPAAVFGLNQLPGLSNASAYSEIMALFIVILVAGVFGARNGALGFLVTGFTVMFFFLALFLPFSYTFYYTILSLSVVGFMVYRRRRSAVVGQ